MGLDKEEENKKEGLFKRLKKIEKTQKGLINNENQDKKNNRTTAT